MLCSGVRKIKNREIKNKRRQLAGGGVARPSGRRVVLGRREGMPRAYPDSFLQTAVQSAAVALPIPLP